MQPHNASLSLLPAFAVYANGSLLEAREGLEGILSDPTGACSSLGASLSLPNVTVNFAQFHPSGDNITLSQDYDLASCGYQYVVTRTDLCRVAMYVSTSNRSGITLEAWLPTNWTGRFLSTGNGGVSGCIQYNDMAYTSGLGFATVGMWYKSLEFGH